MVLLPPGVLGAGVLPPPPLLLLLPPPPAPLPSKLQKKRKKNVDELIKKMRKRRVQTAREIDVARAAIDLSSLLSSRSSLVLLCAWEKSLFTY